MGFLGSLFLGFVVIVVLNKIWQVGRIMLWRPYVLTRSFQKQGIKGPTYVPLYGCLKEINKLKKAARQTVLDIKSNDDITCRVLPHYHQWLSEYGERVLYWYGMQPRVIITDPELAKQVLSTRFGFYVKPNLKPSILKLTGVGLAMIEGKDWVRHRRVLNPAFSTDKLKAMIKQMGECTISMLQEWENQDIRIEMSEKFQKLTADVIAHTLFSSSYLQGREAFKAQRELQKCTVASNTDVFIPGSQYLPTPSNFRMWKLDRQVKKTLSSIIESRLRAKPDPDGCYGDDMLGLMIGSAISNSVDNGETSPKLSMDEIMEECKTFFFAGHETTANLLTWTTFLLSVHQDWQEKLRQEVLKECGIRAPDADMLSNLKLVNMVVLEALRLYGPVIFLARKTLEDMKLGDLMIPKGTCVSIPFIKIHRSKQYWGEDANEFNPMRFVNGVSKAAKHPNALLAFSMGPRTCIGRNFAILEAKTVLALILQRFSLSVCPDYKHAPVDNLTLHPQYGMPINVRPLDL